jgi:speckle-type POZ protein
MEFLNEDFFIAYYTEEKEIDSQVSQDDNSKLVIHFTCAKHCSFGLQIEDVYCGMPDSETWRYNRWLKMEPKHHKKNAELLHFTEQALLGFSKGNLQFRVYFHIKTICTIDNYFYEMMDNKWPTDLWAATKNQNLTDVEIFAGTVKVMEAHRVILCARSPVLNASLTNISYTEKSIVTFGPEFHFEVVYFFLKFLYTGRLEITDSSQQLSKLATIYQVETLKNVCQLLNRVPGVEELTNCLI